MENVGLSQEQLRLLEQESESKKKELEELRAAAEKAGELSKKLTEEQKLREKEAKNAQDARSSLEKLRSELYSLKSEIDEDRTRFNEQLKAKDAELESTRKDLKDLRSSNSKGATELEAKLLEAQEERDNAKSQLAKAEEERRNIEQQYKNLLDRVATLKATIGEKMKADAEELSETKAALADMEEQNRELEAANSDLEHKVRDLGEQVNRLETELGSVRSRMNLAQANWAREKEDLLEKERHLREEYNEATRAMQDWEVIASEERSVRESLTEKISELEEQLAQEKQANEAASGQRERDVSLIESLQKNVHELQEARRNELKTMAAATETQISALNSKLALFETRAIEAEAQFTNLKMEVERLTPFEKEVKEKNLLIGKLRHEAVTLNDHLTKALRMLKKGNASENVDKTLVTNVFLSFLSLQRGDTKRYEVLQLIASVLDWNDEQKERAGLVRPGTSSGLSNLRIPSPSSPSMPPGSAFSRSPSSSTLGDAYDGSRDVSVDPEVTSGNDC